MATSNESLSYVSQAIQFLFPKNCFEELLVKFNVVHPECFRLVLSRFLGLAIVLGSVLVKVPQIMKILSARSGAGISLSSLFLEIIGLSSMVAYSFANKFHFSAWGDACFIVIQTVIITFLVLWYAQRQSAATLFVVVYFPLLAILCLATPMNILAFLQICIIPISIAARGIQATENYQNKSTGQLSFLTCFLQFAGCLARIFTSIEETGDKLVIASFVVATIMNGIIFFQVLIYWGQKPKGKLL